VTDTLNVTVELQPEVIELTVTETPPIQVNFRDIAVPDASVSQNRILAEQAASEAATSASNAANSANNAETSASGAEAAKDAAETAQGAAEAAQGAAELARDQAQEANANCDTAEDNAQTHANNAAASASAAQDAQAAAEQAETNAEAAAAQLLNGYCYLGDANTDGSWRFYNNAGTLQLEKRIAGVWTIHSDFTL
jgi:pyruvate/2-oxoglutarate dehydrogenase complex dihydrolipoamide acyltransferase (E2) component